MPSPSDFFKAGALRAIDPVVGFLARHNVSPNSITTVGTLLTIVAGIVYGTGHIMTAGWIMASTAFFDVLDGEVARRSGRSTVFGAFYDSTLDRVADGALLGGLTVFYATNAVHQNTYMVVVCLVCIVGTFLISYTRARAEALGIDAKVGLMQRPERIVLLSLPQAFFGLFWNGWVLMAIIVLLTVTAWITAIQRIACVYRATLERDVKRSERDAVRTEVVSPLVPIRMVTDPPSPSKTAQIPATRRAQS